MASRQRKKSSVAGLLGVSGIVLVGSGSIVGAGRALHPTAIANAKTDEQLYPG